MLGKWVRVAQSCPTLCDPVEFSRPWNSPGQNTGVSSLSLLQGIFPTQGANPSLPYCRQILYQLSHKGSPTILEWVAYPFSGGSSRPRNWTRVSCMAGGFFTNWAVCWEDWVKQRSWQRMRWLYSIMIPWTWTWASFGRQWGEGRSGVLQSMGSQRVRPDFLLNKTTPWENAQSCKVPLTFSLLFPPVRS